MDDYKIGVFGLSNAGKTSLIKALSKEFNIISSLKPTRGRERTTFELMGKEIYFWDFGGQERYRAKYLNNPVHFFDSFSYVFYVVDIQDADTLDMNILYFKMITKELKTFSPNAKYIILYHKADPDYLKESREKLREEYFQRVFPYIKEEKIRVSLYQTSIYDPFSIAVAFSKPFLEERGIYRNVTDVLNSFGKKNELR